MKINYEKCFNHNGDLIEGPLIIIPKINFDERGFFQESWNKRNFNKVLYDNGQKEALFVQDNHSRSSKGTLRGLHFQKDPYAQGKLVRCINGEIFDVAVDLRVHSKTFLNYISIHLNSKNQKQFWIPRGFAHGFLTLTDNTEVCYKATNYWDKDSELSLNWNDPDINIKWPISSLNKNLNISEKDKNSPYFSELNNEYLFL
jgi:dTDP-4-dehydrorhamnose 3,5-epimerase